jgi:TRAP-type uncharacterized transport system fused permease subunit
MELDDLRRQWQQPQPAADPAALSPTELRGLLARQSGSVIEQLRRNARVEMNINYALLPVSLLVAGLATVLWVRLFGALLALIALVCIFYFRRKLGLLHSMNDPAGDLRSHLVRLITGLRTLIRFYYRLTLATIPVTGLLLGVMSVTSVLKEVTPTKIWLLAGLLTILSLVIYLPVAHSTKRYLHWLYGQHLDRLEGQLRELDEAAPAG